MSRNFATSMIGGNPDNPRPELGEGEQVEKQIPVSCKIDTQSALVYLDKRQSLSVGKTIRIRATKPWSKWREVRVDQINDAGYFSASKL